MAGSKWDEMKTEDSKGMGLTEENGRYALEQAYEYFGDKVKEEHKEGNKAKKYMYLGLQKLCWSLIKVLEVLDAVETAGEKLQKVLGYATGLKAADSLADKIVDKIAEKLKPKDKAVNKNLRKLAPLQSN